MPRPKQCDPDVPIQLISGACALNPPELQPAARPTTKFAGLSALGLLLVTMRRKFSCYRVK
jgi:hypothetical protein